MSTGTRLTYNINSRNNDLNINNSYYTYNPNQNYENMNQNILSQSQNPNISILNQTSPPYGYNPIFITLYIIMIFLLPI